MCWSSQGQALFGRAIKAAEDDARGQSHIDAPDKVPFPLFFQGRMAFRAVACLEGAPGRKEAPGRQIGGVWDLPLDQGLL